MPADTTTVSLRTATAEQPVARRETPQEQPEWKGEMLPTPQKGPRSPGRPWLRWALFMLLPLALIAGAYWYVTGGQVMSTDDAYIEADKVGIATDVPGIVKDIAVTENQRVEAGQVLYRLDPRQFQIALDNARGQPRHRLG